MAVMNNTPLEQQVQLLNEKVDLLLDYVIEQRQKQQVVDDLVTDLSLIGKDAFQSTVEELDQQGIEVDPEQVKFLLIRLLKNIENFSTLLQSLESFSDLMKDIAPIINEMMLNATNTLHKFEKRGYFEFFNEMSTTADAVITHYSKEDLQQLSGNIINIIDTLKGILQPEMLQGINHATHVLKQMQKEDIPEYSLWKAFRQLQKPEMKKALGFLLTFTRKMAKPIEK